MIRVPVSSIITGAAKEINAVSSGEALQPELLVDGLELLNLIFDDWNAEPDEMIYADVFSPYTIVPNTNPQTIGSGGNWNTAQPPTEIRGIQVILAGSAPQPYVYLTPRDARWWQQLPSPTVTAAYPTDFYHNPVWDPTSATPRGAVYLWPVPTAANNVQVWTRQILAALTANQFLGLPPGYAYAMRMILAQRWHSGLRKPWSSKQEQQATDAAALLRSKNNTDPVRIATRDAGMPGSGGGGLPNFMWPYGGVGR